MITKRPGSDGTVRVTFAMPAAIWADTIHVVGDFNGWDERATPLRQTETGWMVTLELEAGRSYQYRYLLNGNEWHNDWNADRYEPNAYGGDNSVVITPDFAAQELMAGATAERVISFTAPRLRLVPTG
ncbi:MAG: glycoside hydrolase family 13 [Chloroflexales bacterium]|nr:glycoside hydrolase family 13 [Chloroflexales bacterium]